MQQNQAIQLAIDPNVYAANRVDLNFDEENVYAMIVSGLQGRQFQFSPKHAKRLLKVLQEVVTKYEAKHGELKVLSPVQLKNESPEPKMGFTTNAILS